MVSATQMLPLFIAALGLWMAADTTRRVARSGATGMAAGMAAMMAAMGTGLSVGYAAGMGWDLGWANLVGVAAGFAHGLWMGRRYGPMAALDGAGGGVMGGLMGPMLAIMLVAAPLSLVWTAGLMLLLQWAFSLGAVYLVAAAAGRAPAEGPLRWAGWLLGAHLVPPTAAADPCEPLAAPQAPQPVLAATRTRTRPGVRSAQPPVMAGPRRSLLGPAVAGGAILATAAAAYVAQSTPDQAARSAADWQPVSAPVGPDGVQEVSVTLQAPYYTPSLTEVKRGVPVRLTLTAVGEPG